MVATMQSILTSFVSGCLQQSQTMMIFVFKVNPCSCLFYPGQQSLSAVKSNESGVFGEMTGSDKSGQQFGSFESNTMQSSSHMMSAPLHTSQRYTLTGDDEVGLLKC